MKTRKFPQCLGRPVTALYYLYSCAFMCLIKFQELVYSESIDVMFVTETWLNSIISDREILPIGYDIYRTDRLLGRPVVGVLIAVKQDTFINCNQISSVSMKNLEAFAIKCTLPNHTKLLAVCCYRPPDSNDMSDFRSIANKLVSTTRSFSPVTLTSRRIFL
jgi:hypothetical protein